MIETQRLLLRKPRPDDDVSDGIGQFVVELAALEQPVQTDHGAAVVWVHAR